MSLAEEKVFTVDDLRRKIFSYLSVLPTCQYCSEIVILHTSTLSNDAICFDCTTYLYEYGIEF